MLHIFFKTPTLSFRYKKGYFVKDNDSAIKNNETNKVNRHGMKADAANGIANENVQRYKRKVAERCECPNIIIRWCRCSLSGAKGERPALVLLIIAEIKSINGIAKTPNGSSIGSKVGASCCAEIAFESIWPVKVMAATPSNKPKTIDPESPIKILAG